MSSVRSTSLFRRLVHLDVFDDQVPRIQTLGIRIGFGILEEAEEELGGFDGPAGSGNAELFACIVPSATQQLGFPFLGLRP